MTDKDREAFENAIRKTYPNTDFEWDGEQGRYADNMQHSAWFGWQAARDHYAPELTEDEFKDILRDSLSAETPVLGAMETFRAAGVRFREEA